MQELEENRRQFEETMEDRRRNFEQQMQKGNRRFEIFLASVFVVFAAAQVTIATLALLD